MSAISADIVKNLYGGGAQILTDESNNCCIFGRRFFFGLSDPYGMVPFSFKFSDSPELFSH